MLSAIRLYSPHFLRSAVTVMSIGSVVGAIIVKVLEVKRLRDFAVYRLDLHFRDRVEILKVKYLTHQYEAILKCYYGDPSLTYNLQHHFSFFLQFSTHNNLSTRGFLE